MTSQQENWDFGLADWSKAGLNVPSGVKSQVATVDSVLVRKIIGRITPADAAMVDRHLRAWFQL